jgi:hypothetical protein
MTTIDSESLIINSPQQDVFAFLADFNHFESLMPEQVINWKSDADTCSFTIRGMSDVSLRITTREPHSKIVIEQQNEARFHIRMTALTEGITENRTRAQIIITADLNPFQNMLMARPLTNLVNILVNKLKEICEKQS